MAGAPFWATQVAQKTGIESSIRKVLLKCYQHGRQILQGVLQKGETISSKPKEVGRIPRDAQRVEIKGPVILPKGSSQELKPGVLGGLVYRANINSLAGELRKRAALQFLGGSLSRNAKHTPIFAFISLAISANQSFEKKVDPTENVFEQIREMFKPSCEEQGKPAASAEKVGCRSGIVLEDLEFGKMISKGCNAAVYEARLKPTPIDEDISIVETEFTAEAGERYIIETSGMGDGSDDSEFSLTDVSDEDMNLADSDISIISEVEAEDTWVDVDNDGAVAVFSIAPVLTEQETNELAAGNDIDIASEDEFNLAVKMMFNYDVESNSDAIMKAMERETIPVKNKLGPSEQESADLGRHVKKKKDLPPHPNIVDMRSVFVGSVPQLDGALAQFPDALPQSQNPDGFGRSQTMFLVMKRYSHTLREYLSERNLSLRSSLLLFAQLLEGVVHMVQHGIAHRDLKSDNILIEERGPNSVHLVISDFGCCLAEGSGLKLPYLSDDVFRGGNRALMAPEIVTAVPGFFSKLEYSQSDVWAAGALGYEIFGAGNPFYRGHVDKRLDSQTYTEEQLPTLPEGLPQPVCTLIRELLNRDPSKRPIPEVAANLIHVFLWSPESWLSGKLPSRDEVTQWLLTLSAKVLCQEKVRIARSRCFRQPSKIRGSWSEVEYELARTFLSRVHVDEMMEAVNMIHV